MLSTDGSSQSSEDTRMVSDTDSAACDQTCHIGLETLKSFPFSEVQLDRAHLQAGLVSALVLKSCPMCSFLTSPHFHCEITAEVSVPLFLILLMQC